MGAPFPLDAWTRQGREAFEFWISFFPTAPLFGVEWRFADMGGRAANPFLQVCEPPIAPVADTPAAPAEPAATDFDAPEPFAATHGGAEAVLQTSAMIDEAAHEAAHVPADIARRPAAAGIEAPRIAGTAVAALAASVEAVARDQDAAEAAIAAAPRPAILLDEKPAETDDLSLIRGIGPGLERQLNALGVWRFDQIARMSEADLAWIDANLTAPKGRCYRDDWVGQAKARLAG